MVKKTQRNTSTSKQTIQIVGVKPKVFEVVKKLAEREGRAIGRQAEQMLIELIEIKGYK